MLLQAQLPPYAELHCLSNFSFLKGASHPEELVERAIQLRYGALAITDECSFAGVVRAHTVAKLHEFPLLIGSEMRLHQPDGTPHARLVLLARTRRGYGNLSHWITVARQRGRKGSYLAHPGDVEGRIGNAPMLAGLADCFALLVPDASQQVDEVLAHAHWLKTWFQERAVLAIELLNRPGDEELVSTVQRAGHELRLPIAATGGVLMHVRSRKPLQDVLTATRLNRPVAQCGWQLEPNAEAHLRSRARLASLYKAEWMEKTVQLAAACSFSLDELKYEYPQEIVPPGETPTSHLRKLTLAGANERYQGALPEAVLDQLEHELALIETLDYERYFLTVADIVHWARAHDILCQGRGSAANSAVCYCLKV
ncbi:MAG TPA: PHP domain-containing protein, partial [Rhizobacter sp.]|nr:PHP domain-containing protein [Rhizobacter sp.]